MPDSLSTSTSYTSPSVPFYALHFTSTNSLSVLYLDCRMIHDTLQSNKPPEGNAALLECSATHCRGAMGSMQATLSLV